MGHPPGSVPSPFWLVYATMILAVATSTTTHLQDPTQMLQEGASQTAALNEGCPSVHGESPTLALVELKAWLPGERRTSFHSLGGGTARSEIFWADLLEFSFRFPLNAEGFTQIISAFCWGWRVAGLLYFAVFPSIFCHPLCDLSVCCPATVQGCLAVGSSTPRCLHCLTPTLHTALLPLRLWAEDFSQQA